MYRNVRQNNKYNKPTTKKNSRQSHREQREKRSQKEHLCIVAIFFFVALRFYMHLAVNSTIYFESFSLLFTLSQPRARAQSNVNFILGKHKSNKIHWRYFFIASLFVCCFWKSSLVIVLEMFWIGNFWALLVPLLCFLTKSENFLRQFPNILLGYPEMFLHNFHHVLHSRTLTVYFPSIFDSFVFIRLFSVKLRTLKATEFLFSVKHIRLVQLSMPYYPKSKWIITDEIILVRSTQSKSEGGKKSTAEINCSLRNHYAIWNCLPVIPWHFFKTIFSLPIFNQSSTLFTLKLR